MNKIFITTVLIMFLIGPARPGFIFGDDSGLMFGAV